MRRRPFLSLSILFISLSFASILAHTDTKNAEETENGNNNKVEPERPKSDEVAKDRSGGFGTDIEWVPWEQAVSVALDLNRPIFLLIHKSWCGACDALKKSFATSPQRKELLELSKHFVMANTEDEEEPEEEEYAPDGRYIPRLFLLNKHGVRLPVDNKKNYPSNIAYFPQVPDVIRAMKLGLEEFEKEQKKGAERAEEGESVVEKEKKKKEEKREKEEGKKKKTDTESTLEKKITKKDESKAEDEAGKGGCPHAAGKAAAKRKKEEEERKKQTKEKSTEKKEAAEKKADGGKEKNTGKKETNSKKAELQKKIKGAEKEKEEL